ncbi:MAG: hypothetical protein HC894_12440 [Microcoleus sp. SM1_3_4]|nr:hypothetical protein [Microcoleus sp. SM1_3_4]
MLVARLSLKIIVVKSIAGAAAMKQDILAAGDRAFGLFLQGLATGNWQG